MTDYDRGAYAPHHDAPLTFDARMTRGEGRPQRPFPLTLVASGIILIALIAAVALFYRNGVRHSGPPQVVGTPVGQTKTPPPPSAQPSDPAATLQVYKTEITPAYEGTSKPIFTPAPEQPGPRVTGLPPAAPAPAQPTQMATATPAAKPTVAAPAAKAAAPTTANTATTSTAQPGATAAGGSMVQIGAFSSAALADKGWSDMASLVPDQMTGKTKKVEAATKDGKTFYRVFATGFASRGEAASFCDAIKAAGKGCMVK